MANKNNFKPFSIAPEANVTSQADWESLSVLSNGFSSGKASSGQVNKALRQGTVMASVLAQFISDSADVDVLDDGMPSTILTNLNSAMTALTSGRLLGAPQVFTSSGVFNPKAMTKSVIVMVIGGGGGGGGAAATSSGYMAGGSGGGGGGCSLSYLSAGFSGVSVVVGSAGTQGTAAPSAGGVGGTSSFGNLLSATGGASGGTQPGVPSGSLTLQIGGQGGIGSGGNICNVRGGAGGNMILNSTGNSVSGCGGSSLISGSVRSTAVNGAGVSGTLGSGGSGSASGSSPAGGYLGGSGGAGIVIVWEYA